MGSAVRLVADTVVAGDYDLFGFDAQSGKPAWVFKPTNGYAAGIYLGDSDGLSVFAGSPSGTLYSVSAATGAPNWSTVISEAAKTTVFVPTVDGDDVLCHYTTFAPSVRGGIALVSRLTGDLRWKFEFPSSRSNPNARNSGGGPVAVGDKVFAAAGDGRIHILNRRTGRAEGVVPPLQVNGKPWGTDFRALSVVGSTLVAGSQSGVLEGYAVTRPFRRRWQLDTNLGSVKFRIAAGPDGIVYVPTFAGTLVAIAAGTGLELWRIGGGAAARYDWLPAVDGNRIYIGSAEGLVALAK